MVGCYDAVMESADDSTLFPATDWTVVLRVRAGGEEHEARQAMAQLCMRYWYPLYAFARRRGLSPHDAEDRTQSFFQHIVETNLFASAEQQLGKLRTFLIVAFDRHLNRVRVHEQAMKRGGGHELVPIDALVGEERYLREPADDWTPERIYQRSWAMTVLQTAVRELGIEEATAGREKVFCELKAFLSPDAEAEGSYAATAARLGMKEEAVRQGVSRLRQRFRLRLRQHIAATLHEPDEARVEEELAALRAALRG